MNAAFVRKMELVEVKNVIKSLPIAETEMNRMAATRALGHGVPMRTVKVLINEITGKAIGYTRPKSR